MLHNQEINIQKDFWIFYASKKLYPQSSFLKTKTDHLEYETYENYHNQILKTPSFLNEKNTYPNTFSNKHNNLSSSPTQEENEYSPTSVTKDDFLNTPSAINSIEEAKREAGLIFAHCLNIDKVQMLLHTKFTITEAQKNALENCLERRSKGEPLAYIFGKKEFFSLNFKVNQHTLIPRPETEQLVELMLEENEKNKTKNMQSTFLDKTTKNNTPLLLLDLGCGTGCISLSFLKNIPQSQSVQAFLCDISPDTLEVAKENARNLDLQEKTDFLLKDFTSENFISFLQEALDKKNRHLPFFDIIVSNPPYIPQVEYENLHPCVRNFEPEMALVSSDLTNLKNKGMHHSIQQQDQFKNNALFHIQAVIKIAERFLKPQGLLLIEHGYNQGENVRTICTTEHFSQASSIIDYAGIARFLKAIKK